MGSLIRFFVISVAGIAGVKSMEASPIAGLIFFALSAATLVSLLNEFGVVAYADWPFIFSFVVNGIDSIIDGITG